MSKCHKLRKKVGQNVSLATTFLVILIFFRPMADDRHQSETLDMLNKA
jgi:hypothetical protein